MIKKQKFVDEISKKEFDTEEQARKSENRSKEIKSAFSFYRGGPKDGNDGIGV